MNRNVSRQGPTRWRAGHRRESSFGTCAIEVAITAARLSSSSSGPSRAPIGGSRGTELTCPRPFAGSGGCSHNVDLTRAQSLQRACSLKALRADAMRGYDLLALNPTGQAAQRLRRTCPATAADSWAAPRWHRVRLAGRSG